MRILIAFAWLLVVSQVAAICRDDFASTPVRFVGDWQLESGSTANWLPNDPKTIGTFDASICQYTLIVKGLKPNSKYSSQAVINGAFSWQYGCGSSLKDNCPFTTNSDGAIRFLLGASWELGHPKHSTDYNIDGIVVTPATAPPVTDASGSTVTTHAPLTTTNTPCDGGVCPTELPNCDRFNLESCSGQQFHANPDVGKRRWQTPKPNANKYQASYQHQHQLVGYADIRYTNPSRSEADVCIVVKQRFASPLVFTFNGVEQAAECKRFGSSQIGKVSLKVSGADGTSLDIAGVDLMWNNQKLANRAGDYRNGQKGGVAELFGWQHQDVEKECELIAKAGYLGVKLFPVHEHLMSHQPFENVMNPWYFMYQPVSYKLDGRGGSREQLASLINTCRRWGARVYVDAVLNHMTGAGNDMNNHRNPNGCVKWGNKTSTAPLERQSPFYTHAFTYQFNVNSNEAPSNEFPGASFGPEDFHCERSLNSWNDLFILNNGWLVGLTDLDTSRDNVQERQAAYLVEMMSMGVSGFRIDAAKHMSPEDLSAIFKKIQTKMGGKLPDDFFVWLEVITGGEAGQLWWGPSWYGTMFEKILLKDLGTMEEVNKIKIWDGLYPKEPGNNPMSKYRVVIQNDDHDQQNPGSSSRDMEGAGCVLIKNCPEDQHRNFEIRLFSNPGGVGNNDNDWPIRFILSSYYHTLGSHGIPDGLSNCDMCTTTCSGCKESMSYHPASVAGECAYKGLYTKVHRDIRIINAMRAWVKLGPIGGGDIGLPGC